MPLFIDFYKIAISPTNGGEFPNKRIDKEIGAENRPHIAEALQALRDHGFYPDGFNDKGEVKWRVVLKSKCQVEYEKGIAPLMGKTREQCKKIVSKYGDIFTRF